MIYLEYIRTELLILTPVLYIVGVCIKKSGLPNKLIPLLLGIISISLSLIWVISQAQISTFKECAAAVFTAITQGALAAGASVYFNQIYKQIKK